MNSQNYNCRSFFQFMDEESRYWVIPIIAFISVGLLLVVSVNERMNTPERYIEPEVIVEKKTISTGLSPYVEFCNPNDDFAPDKLIQNDTHKFDHVICQWGKK